VSRQACRRKTHANAAEHVGLEKYFYVSAEYRNDLKDGDGFDVAKPSENMESLRKFGDFYNLTPLVQRCNSDETLR
jgi:hypothetical protein